jgi:L-lactate dehydrogenase complex protein LldG
VTRIVVPGDLPMALRPAGVRVLEDDRMSPVELDGLDGVVTTCAAACAETGTIAFDGGDGQGRRAVTLVPDLHVCVVRTGQVVETVPELFERLAPSAREGRPIVLVSGPSATSDIEFERVEGVHGPRHLVVVLLEEDGRARP